MERRGKKILSPLFGILHTVKAAKNRCKVDLHFYSNPHKQEIVQTNNTFKSKERVSL